MKKHLSHKYQNIRHITTDFFLRGEERKQRQLVEEEARAGTSTAITAYRIPLSPVTSLKYLGRVLSSSDKDCTTVVCNLLRAQQKQAQLYRVLVREVSDARTLGGIYVAVVHAVLLYRSETWVMTPLIGRVWG